MKISFLLLGLFCTLSVLAQQNSNDFPDYDRVLILEPGADTTANVSFGDLDGDGHLDMLLVKGRHWPIVDRVLLGDGKGGIRNAYELGSISDRSYTGGLADFNGDGTLDIAISNDAPDRKLVYFNDGKGQFVIGSEFGVPEWPTRNLSIADINKDGLPDLILANRGRAPLTNYICLNKGKGKFDAECISFAPYPSTTITAADFDQDGYIDLVVPHRNGGQSYLYRGTAEMNYSEAQRIPFGPANAKIRMAAVADFNGDQLSDIVVIDEEKGVDLYFGQKDLSFSAGNSLADAKTVPYAMLVADLNNDKRPDIIVGHVNAPSTVLFNTGNGNPFHPVSFGDATGTVYGFAVGDFNEDGIPDIAAARSEAINILYFGSMKSKEKK